MEIKIIKSGNIAINPRTVLTLTKGDVITLGDKGINEANIKRMIELGFAENGEIEVQVEEVKVEKNESVEELVESESLTDEPVSEIDSFDDKDELEKFAKEFYNISLDKRKSLENMKEALKLALEEKGDK